MIPIEWSIEILLNINLFYCIEFLQSFYRTSQLCLETGNSIEMRALYKTSSLEFDRTPL